MPRPPTEPINMGQILIEDVSPEAGPLVKHDSQYRAIHERILAAKPGTRFRATLPSDYSAQCARASALGFAGRNEVPITTSLLGSTIEITRLDNEPRRESVE